MNRYCKHKVIKHTNWRFINFLLPSSYIFRYTKELYNLKHWLTCVSVSPTVARHNAARGLDPHAGSSGQASSTTSNAAANTNSIKMESGMAEPISSTSTSTSLSFAPPTLTPAISPSHYRASPYKPDWQGPPSGVH